MSPLLSFSDIDGRCQGSRKVGVLLGQGKFLAFVAKPLLAYSQALCADVSKDSRITELTETVGSNA
jgi:hypothetical protein